ncbi:serine/threonine-protein kinase [Adlercreutzia sp. ZJ141]|uniref:serine/threonine-protein kinase n=1 Tax=Adlercreutzia sp. ZJ141 TaxID=2709406 RepID=UPI0013EB2F9C|nr:serine/threonine-protein kinase [Adlercreutzia sp. ZJ141]
MKGKKLILDRYRPVEQAGAGGFGTVVKAWDTRIQRYVAIKTIQLSERDAAGVHELNHPSLPAESAFPADPEFLDARSARLRSTDTHESDLPDSTPLVRELANLPGLDEARTAAMLEDPNIVSVHDFEVRDSTAYLIMEYVEGMSLSKLLHEYDSQLTLNQIAAVFEGVAHALCVAHANGVLHLDIKPDNVLIDVKGQVKVTDFGLATLADETGVGYAGGGTIGYMPPEQIDRQPLDERCDEWALAAVTYEMLSGENPFRVRSLEHAAAAIVDAELVLPSLCWDDLNEEADNVLFDALDPDADARFATVEEFADEYLPYLGDVECGIAELASVVSCGDFEDPDDEDEWGSGEVSPHTRFVDRLRDIIPASQALSRHVSPRALSALAHGVGCVGSAIVSWIALSGIAPLVAGGSAAGASAGAGAASTVAFVGANPWLVVPLVVVALLGLVVPHVGALASLEMLAVALVVQGQPAAGVLFAAVTAAWWYFAGKASKGSANVAFSPVLAGAVGLGQVAPLVAGFSLPPMRALAATVYSLVVALVLSACGPELGPGSLAGIGSLSGWDISLCLSADGFANMQEVAVRVLVSPQFWCTAASWLAASFLLALFRRRQTRAFAVAGVAVSGVVIVAGLIGGAWMASGGVSLVPAPADCALAFASIAAMFLCCLFVPSKHDAHGGVYFADAS